MSVISYLRAVTVATIAVAAAPFCWDASAAQPIRPEYQSGTNSASPTVGNQPSSNKFAEVKKRIEFPSANPFPNSRVWTDQEKTLLMESLAEAATLAPGLLENITKDRKLAVFRVSKANMGGERSLATAFVSNGRIVFADSFFDRGILVRSLLHELIHVADCGHRISLGRDWIGFANPIISEMRVRQTFREPFSWTEESHFAKLSKDFSAYGSRRLVESLPEYFAVRLVNRQTEIPDSPESRTLDRLLHPNENDLSFFRQYRLAENAENMNKTDKALTYYMAASKCDPSWFSVHVKLAGVLKGKREAIEELNKALDLMDQSGIPSSESTAVGVTVRKAQLHASLGDRVEADALMSKVVRNTLGDSSWRFYLSHINESLHQYGAAAADLYASRYFDRTIECSFGKFTNSANVFQRFKKSLKRGAGLGELYRRRAIFNVLEGDRADVEERRKYYEAAIHDYGKSMEHQGVGMTEGLFECAQICIRMKDQSQAAIFRDALRELDPISLPASVIALQLLEFGGDRQDCETRYRSLRELIEKKSEPEKRRPERSQWPGWLADNGSSEF